MRLERKFPPRLLQPSKRFIENLWRGWSRFFFDADGTEQLRLFRLVFGLLLFTAYSIRALDSNFFFGMNGVLDLNRMLDNFPMEYRWSFLIWFPSQTVLGIHTVVFLSALLAMAFGFFPRISALIAFLLHVSFMHRNMAIVYGLDTISVFFLFYLIFAQTKKPVIFPRESWSALLTSAAYRMCQIQVCVIYAFSGWEKLKGPAWWRGEAIWTVFNSHFARFHVDWISHFPLVISFLTYLTLLWEMYFPAFIWHRKWRPYVLAGGVMLHLGIATIVIIPFFSAMMIASYGVFLTSEEAHNVLEWISKISNRKSSRFALQSR